MKSWFAGTASSVNSEIITPFSNAEQIIYKYNQAIEHNSLTQQGWQRLIAQCDDGLASYLTNIKGSAASMSSYSVSLQGNITGYTKITQAMKQYNALGAVSQKEQQNFATAISLTNTKLGSYLTGLNGAKASLGGYGVSLIASTAKTVGLTIATTALNAALTFGISAIITGVVSAFATWINSSKKITEAAEEAKDKISSINDDLKTNTETVENAKQRYAELAQEVENLGKVSQSRGSLSTDEYEEFLDLSNQLAGVFPQLTKGYDDNGNAILDLSGNVNTIVGSLDDLLQKEKDLANQKIMDEFPNVYKGYVKDLEDAESEVESAKKKFDDINSAYSNLDNGQSIQMGFLSTGYNKEGTMSIGQYESWLETLGLTYEETVVQGGKVVSAVGDINDAFTSQLETARKNLQYAEQQLEGEKSSIDSYLNTWLQSEFTYNQIDDSGLQTAVQDMIMNFDFSSLPKDKRNNWDYVSEYLRRNILFAINDVQDDPEISKAISEVFTNQDLTPEEKANYLQQIKDYFNDLLGEDNAISISLQPQIDDTNALEQSYTNTINRFKSSEEANLEDLKQSYQEAIDKRKELYSGENYVGNVDINNRPVVINDDGSYSTTSTSFQEKWVGDEENGHYIIAHFTPILPDGTVLDEDSLNEYIDKILNSDDPMEADKVENGGKGIIYKVDTEINGKEINDDNLEDAFGVADAWDIDMHNLQDKMYRDEAKIKGQIAQFGNDVDGSQKIKDFFDTEGINTDEEINEFNEVTKGINDADKAIQAWNEHKKESNETPILSTDELKEKISDLNSAIDSIQSAYDTLNSAVEEYNSNGGQLSIDTIQSLMGLSSEYLACLQEENGQLSVNQEAIAALANAKLDEAQALAIEQAMTELDTISKGENTSATADYVSGNAALMESLQILAGKYDNVASSAMTAVQAQALSSGISAASAVDPEATKATMAALDKKLEMISKARNQISSGNLSGLKKSSSSGSSSKSSKDELKEAFQAEYDLLKHNLEMEYITEEQYYNGVQALNEKYFAGKEEYLDDYRKYEEEVYKGLKSYYKSYCDDMMDYYDKKLDASKMSYKEYCDSVSRMLADMHNSGKISDKDWYDYTKTMLEKQKDAYDRALSAITRRLQKEIDAWQAKIDALNDQNDVLNDQKDNMDSAIDAITRVYDAEIDRIQGIIDGLKNANDERERTLALEQAKYELEKAYNQRVKKIYTEGKGYTYEVDYDAIKDAQKTYDDAELDVKTDELQKQIETLEEFKKKWQDVQNAYQQSIDDMNATALLGSEYQKLILNNNIIDIENFKTKYLAIQAKINDNEELIKSYEEKVDYYNKLKDQWSSLSDEYSNSVDDMYAKMLLGQSWETDVLNGRLSTLNDFRNQYNDIQKSISDMAWQSANAQISALNAVKAAEATKAQTSGGSNGYSGSSGSTTSVGSKPSSGSGLTAAQKYQVRLAGTVKVIYEGSSETDLRNWITRNNYIGVSRTIQGNIIIYFAKKKEKKYIGQVYKTSGQAASQVGMLGGAGYDKVSGGYQVYKYAKGTDNAKKGWHIVSEDNPELIVRNNGEIELAKGKQFYNFEGGEKVIPANETKEILKNQGNVESLSNSDVITRKDGSILKPIHYEYENMLANFIKDNPDYMYSMNTMSDNVCRDLFKNTENVNYDNRSVDNRVSIGEIHLHEVQNPDQFVKELDRQLVGIVDQKLSRRKR